MPTKLLPTAERSPEPGRAIGTMIQLRREARQWSQHDLARQTRLAETFISRVEHGKVANPYRSTREKFGQALALQVADF